MDTDTTTVLTDQSYSRNSENKINCIELGIVPATISGKTASAEFRYELFGWSTNKNEPAINYEQLEESEAILAEEAARKKYNEAMLTNIEGDRVFYPVFKAIRRDYAVTFSANDEKLKELRVLYGSIVPELEYSGLLQEDSNEYDAPGIYKFTGWAPKPEDTLIIGDTEFYAQFVEDELTLADIGSDNYSISNGCILITGCDNKFNDAVKILESYEIERKEYPVISIGGFGNDNIVNAYTNLEFIKLPNTLYQLTQYAFAKCINLKEIEIPSNITQIPGWAFANCEKLTKVDIKGNVDTLGATCFYNCYLLSEINLKEGLSSILSYAFYQTAIKDVVIPSTVHTIGECAFGGMSNLGTVTFKEYLQDGNIRLPDIHVKAFNGSNVTLRFPWSESAHMGKYAQDGKDPRFGAANATLEFDCKEVNS
jgi:hypothetical protein